MPEAAYAPVNGLQMYYEVHGVGSPLVLLHGGVQTIELSFGAMIPTLAQQFRVIAVELQGHGHTADIDREMTLEALASDVLALLDQLSIERADLLGYSLGGCVALEIVKGSPAAVGKLALISTPTCRNDFALDGQVAAEHMPTAADGAQWKAEYRKVAPNPDGFHDLLKKASSMVAGVEDRSPQELQAVASPTLMVIGDRDFVTIDRAREVLGLIPDVQLGVLPGASHVEVARRPQQLLALVMPFLRS